MRTDGAIITNAGQELLSYALANNKQVNFTKVKLGKGDVNTFDEAKKLTDVVSFYKQIPITSIARNNAGIVRIRSSFTNADFPLQVVLKEIGVFAVVEGKSEVLFGYVNDGEGESFPPGSSGNIVERVRDIYVGVSTNTQVTAVVDRSVVYATIYDLDEEIAKCAKKITRVNPGNGIHGGGTLGEDITVSIKSNDTSINLDATNGITLKKTTSWLNDAAQLFTAKGALNLFNTLTTNFTDAINVAKEALRIDIARKEDKFGKNSGFNKEKTDLVENDTNKVFSAKGAFDLKTYLITNYTTLMNNIRDTLTNSINTKLPHGGYNQSAQTLKNEIDDRYTKSQSDSRYPRFLGIINTSTNLDTLTQSGYYNGVVSSQMLGGFSIYEWGLFVVEKSEEACVQTYYSHQHGHIIRRVGYGNIDWQSWYRVYTSLQKPTKSDVGLSEVDNTPDSSKSVRSAARLTTARNITIGDKTYPFDGTSNISYSLSDIGTYSKSESDSRSFIGRGALITQDWNNIGSIGVYSVDNATGANMPSEVYAWGNLCVFNSAGTITQVYYPHANNYGSRYAPVYRVKYGDSWIGWKKLYGDNYNPSVTDIRMSGNTKIITYDKAVDTYASGRVQTGSFKDNQGAQLDGVYYAALQKCVNGTWYTVATS